MFVITEPDVVLRLMFLDEVTFKNLGFEFTVGNDPIKIGHLRYHPTGFGRMIGALLEVRSYTIPQIDCFTDVEDNAILVLMKIASGLCREILQLFSQCQRVINIIHPGLFYLVS